MARIVNAVNYNTSLGLEMQSYQEDHADDGAW